ncbi:hypothetical protein C6P08_08375 [Weissella confusa]|uniref:hypothetical protein n=1 Tax=Weissella confusa TaxID=1583 RepID=UPI001092EF46|nr:hypothetical protein [Weissella confusa]MBJ7694693.1 hypothetical protein [Weissella confusa]QBZ05211.1 hypothetical protein C6P08_08375 [Weissella confusa]
MDFKSGFLSKRWVQVLIVLIGLGILFRLGVFGVLISLAVLGYAGYSMFQTYKTSGKTAFTKKQWMLLAGGVLVFLLTLSNMGNTSVKEANQAKSESTQISTSSSKEAGKAKSATKESTQKVESANASQKSALESSNAASQSQAKADSEAKASSAAEKLAGMNYGSYTGQMFVDQLKSAGVSNIKIEDIEFSTDDSGAVYTYPAPKAGEGEYYDVFVEPSGNVKPLYDPFYKKKAKKMVLDNISYVESAANYYFEQNGYTLIGHSIIGGTNASYDQDTGEFSADFTDAEVRFGGVKHKHQLVTVAFKLKDNKFNTDMPNGGVELVKIELNGTQVY